MGIAYKTCTIAALILTSEARHVFKHEAVEVQRRQAGPPIKGPPPNFSASTTQVAPGVLTVITPFPGASPVSVTSQSQVVTSYIPQFTICELPPLEFFSFTPLPSLRPTTAPYRNYSMSIPSGNGTCTTLYSQTQTTVCATTLSDLVTTYPVTNCEQEITFSSQFGYALITPAPTVINSTVSNSTVSNSTDSNATSTFYATITPAPYLQSQTTYYLAPWTELTAAAAPKDVLRKVCFNLANGTEECITEYEVWHTSLVTYVATSTVSLNVSTTISGPSQIIWETFVANVTEAMTTFSLTTTMEKAYTTEYLTTHQSSASVSTAPAVFETLTVEQASPSSTSAPVT